MAGTHLDTFIHFLSLSHSHLLKISLSNILESDSFILFHPLDIPNDMNFLCEVVEEFLEDRNLRRGIKILAPNVLLENSNQSYDMDLSSQSLESTPFQLCSALKGISSWSPKYHDIAVRIVRLSSTFIDQNIIDQDDLRSIFSTVSNILARSRGASSLFPVPSRIDF